VILDDLSTGRRENVRHLLTRGKAELVEGSVLDEALVDDLMRDADTCFHLAAAVGVKLVVSRPLASLLGNVRGAEIVIGAAARHRKQLVFTSSSEIYGKQGEHAIHEDSDRILGALSKSRWGYSTAKAIGEILAYEYFRERGTPTIVARLFNTVGPRQTGAYGMVLPRFVRQALRGEDLTVYGNGTQTRCFIHVHDAVDALVRLSDREGALGRAFNVGNPGELSITALARKVIGRTGSRSSIRFVPYGQAYPEGFEELGRRRPDTAALQRLTGWRPRRTVDDAIDDVVRYDVNSAALPGASTRNGEKRDSSRPARAVL
jgi:UDP-glucose 4-epimerase